MAIRTAARASVSHQVAHFTAPDHPGIAYPLFPGFYESLLFTHRSRSAAFTARSLVADAFSVTVPCPFDDVSPAVTDGTCPGHLPAPFWLPCHAACIQVSRYPAAGILYPVRCQSSAEAYASSQSDM